MVVTRPPAVNATAGPGAALPSAAMPRLPAVTAARLNGRAHALASAGYVRLASRLLHDERALERGLDAAAAITATRARAGCVVFSKDRAMQLDACLRSIERFAPYDGPITVIYTATTPAFAAGYGLLAPGPRVRLVAQGDDFRRDVLAAIDERSPLTVFHTDDDLFFRRPPLAPSVPDGFAAFSLRLGENTTYAYTTDRALPLPAHGEQGPVIAWSWTRAVDDFAYPFSLEGHLMRTDLVRALLSGIDFASPNQLEGRMHVRRAGAPRLLLAFRQSCVVSVPVNTVNTSTRPNRAGRDPRLSAEALNERLLAGDRIDLDAVDFSSIGAAHCELDLPLARAGA
jgi:hypothetical protein